MSKNVLVAYASVSGSTGDVADAIGDVLAQRDVTVVVEHVRQLETIAGYSAVVLGSSIRAGRWLSEAFQFLETHIEALSEMPVAYFTTCLTMVNDTEDSRRTVRAYMEPVLRAAPEIVPVGLGLFAGSFDPPRQQLYAINPGLAPHGDYRNWEAIRGWAAEIAPRLLEEMADDSSKMLQDAVLTYADMAGENLKGADLKRADLTGADLNQANLHGADLQRAKLSEAGLNWSDLNLADMTAADLHGANLIGADLNRANLKRADLSNAILNGANLSRAKLNGANLQFADLNWANLSGADLSNAHLGQANLGWANLSGAKLQDVELQGARYNNLTQWPADFDPQAFGGILVGSDRK